MGKEHVEECKTLLKLMGIPYVTAPCEAEAQCAELVKGGKVREPPSRFPRHQCCAATEPGHFGRSRSRGEGSGSRLHLR